MLYLTTKPIVAFKPAPAPKPKPKAHEFFRTEIHKNRDEAEMGEIMRAFECKQPKAGAVPNFKFGVDPETRERKNARIDKIINFIRENPGTTKTALCQQHGVTAGTIKADLQTIGAMVNLKSRRQKIAGKWAVRYEVQE